MSTRWPREAFGTQIVYVRDDVARKATSLVASGGHVWALLPDGRVGTNDARFFKVWYGKGSKSELNVAERLWRLGKLKKSDYQKLAKAYDQKQARDDKRRCVSELQHFAKQIGLVLTKDQARLLNSITR